MSQRTRPPLLAILAVLCVAALVIALAACCKPGEPTVSPTLSPTPTPPPTSTPIPTWTPTPTPIPTPRLPVLPGTPVPLPRVPITPENAADVVELALWGKGEIHRIAYSPDGRLLAIGSESGLWLYDAETLELVRFIETSLWVDTFDFTPDGATIIAGLGASTVASWDVTTGECLTSLKVRESVGYPRGLGSFSVHGATLAAISEGNPAIQVWDVEKGKLLHTLAKDEPLHTSGGGPRWVSSLAFSPDGALLASGGTDDLVMLWDVKTGTLLRALEGHTDSVFALAFSPDGTLLVSNSADDGVYLWDVETGTLLQTIEGHFDSVSGQPFSPGGLLLALEWKRTVRIWNVETGRIVQAWDHASDVQGLAFSPDGTTLATGAWSHIVQSWDIETGALLGVLEGYHRSVSASAISPDDTIFLSHFWEDGEIEAWDVKTGQIVRTLEGHTSGVTNLALSADGTTLASSEIWDLSVWVWDVETGRRLRTLGHHATFVRSIALSPDGSIMASGSDAKYAGVYDVQTGESLHILGHEDPVHRLTFSPDGGKLATGTWNILRLWDTETGELLRTLEVPEGYGGGGIVFSPDGDMVAAGANDGTVWLLDVDTGRSVRSFRGHTGGVSSVAFSPGGALLASAAGDRTVRLWDVETGRLVHMLDTGSVGTLTFSQDGLILAGAGSGILRLWGIPPTD